jgi:hypothetical protein
MPSRMNKERFGKRRTSKEPDYFQLNRIQLITREQQSWDTD